MSHEKELRHIIKKIKHEFIPEAKYIIRIQSLIEKCKTCAFELY